MDAREAVLLRLDGVWWAVGGGKKFRFGLLMAWRLDFSPGSSASRCTGAFGQTRTPC